MTNWLLTSLLEYGNTLIHKHVENLHLTLLRNNTFFGHINDYLGSKVINESVPVQVHGPGTETLKEKVELDLEPFRNRFLGSESWFWNSIGIDFGTPLECPYGIHSLEACHKFVINSSPLKMYAYLVYVIFSNFIPRWVGPHHKIEYVINNTTNTILFYILHIH